MWLYNNKEILTLDDIPEGVVGFIYLIIDLPTTHYYIGKKNLYSFRTLPPLKGYKRKRKVTKESNWLTYQSSNDTVKAWVSPYKEVLQWCYSKKELTYREIEAIIRFQGLEDPMCLNDNLLGKFFSSDLIKPTNND
jgi:hypothetical protein